VAAYDFSAPFVAARIVLPNGDAYPLWTNVGGAETVRPTIPGQEDLQALCFVQEVQVQLGLAGLPQLSVQLSPPFEDGVKFLDSPLADGLRTNRLEVQLGYAGGTGDAGAVLTAPFVAALTAPEVTVDVEVQINLKGQGLGQSAQLEGGRVTGWPHENREDIIRRLAAGRLGTRRTLEVDFSTALANAESRRLLKESAAEYVQGNRTDWLALWELAQTTHCIMNIVGPTDDGTASRLLWMPRRSEPFAASAPTRRYRLYHYPGGQLHGTSGTPGIVGGAYGAELPLLSFSCNTEAIWNAVTYQDVMNSGVELTGVDADAVVAAETTVTLEEQAEAVDGGEGAQTIEASDTEDAPAASMSLPGDTDSEEAVDRARTEVSSGAAMTLRCEIETIGDPGVLPGDAIALAGLGRRFDNRVYHVLELTHSIGVGGYSTNLVIQSNIDPVRTGRQPTGPRATVDLQQRAVGEGYTARPPIPLQGSRGF